jgi:7,8-dihydropterin-6-yl-methyl-4-(beta-D-ribofuranosyl)aminobenzene 5'-phosphate synthase
VLTGCGHAGIVNIVKHVQRVTGEERIAAVIGGFHLSGPMFEPIIEPTVAAFDELEPGLLMPAHCTGWKAMHRLAARFQDAFVASTVGTTIVL